jgi:hypothetical protein
MPLRDHFHPPLFHRRHWEGFHSAWANTIVRHLSVRLPHRYYAEPQIHLGVDVETDVVTLEEEQPTGSEGGGGDGVATAVWAPAKPTQSVAVTFPEQDLFEVQVFDEQRASRLVAVVEFVSPGNKDRPAKRRAFAVKCASYLQQLVSVVVVDVVTSRHDDLSAEVLGLLGVEEAPGWPCDPPLYAIAWRATKGEEWRLDTWAEPLRLGAALPTLPLWLADNLAVPLELEPTYEETCQVLRIR